jgi:predicted RNase H-like HicB family nuclease
MASYIALLRKEAKSDFGVSFPDLPGCVTAGKTLDEARRFAAEALALHLAGMAADGEAVPEPSTLDEIARTADLCGTVPFLVEAPAAGRVRVNIMLDAALLRNIDAYTELAGLTRSAYLELVAQRGLMEPARPPKARRHPSRERKVAKVAAHRRRVHA